MNFFLFQKYGLNEKEENYETILQALESFKEKADWDTKLNSKNDKIRSRAKEEKQRWTDDKEILLDDSARAEYLEQYFDAVKEIVEYIKDNDSAESSFEEIAAIQGITVETARIIFEKHKDIDIQNKADLNEIQALAFKINKVQNNFNLLVSKCDSTIKNKFIENGVDINSLFDALSVNSCNSASEIEKNSYTVSRVAYELYNRQIFSSDIKNEFMDIFDAKSTKEESVIGFVNDELFEKYFSANNWVLLRYIRSTCTLMKKTGTISGQKLSNINSADKKDFINAMNQVFGVTFDSAVTTEETKKRIPSEIAQGEKHLKNGDFKTALYLFKKASDTDPYCWQAYWGMFKASIKAHTDSEVYFPGFLKTLRDSETNDSHPDYIDYYKSAKFNATAQKSAEINFASIEMEYKNADLVNTTFIDKANDIKARYESGRPENILSDKGKKAAAQVVETMKEYNKWNHMNLNGNLFNIITVLIGVLLMVLAAAGILSKFSENITMVTVIATLVIGVLVGIIGGFISGKILLGIIIGFLSVTVLSWVVSLVTMIPMIFSPISAALGFIVILKGLNKIKVVKSAEAKAEELHDISVKALENLASCFCEDLETLRNTAECIKYNVPIPNSDFNYSAYVDEYFSV